MSILYLVESNKSGVLLPRIWIQVASESFGRSSRWTLWALLLYKYCCCAVTFSSWFLPPLRDWRILELFTPTEWDPRCHIVKKGCQGALANAANTQLGLDRAEIHLWGTELGLTGFSSIPSKSRQRIRAAPDTPYSTNSRGWSFRSWDPPSEEGRDLIQYGIVWYITGRRFATTNALPSYSTIRKIEGDGVQLSVPN